MKTNLFVLIVVSILLCGCSRSGISFNTGYATGYEDGDNDGSISVYDEAYQSGYAQGVSDTEESAADVVMQMGIMKVVRKDMTIVSRMQKTDENIMILLFIRTTTAADNSTQTELKEG